MGTEGVGEEKKKNLFSQTKPWKFTTTTLFYLQLNVPHRGPLREDIHGWRPTALPRNKHVTLVARRTDTQRVWHDDRPVATGK